VDATQHTDWQRSVSYNGPATSAEWIEEAPTVAANNSLENLADFGTVTFSSLAALGPGTATATALPVYMVDKSGHVIAYPTQYEPRANSFGVAYGSVGTVPSNPTGVLIGPTAATSSSSTTTTTSSPTTSSVPTSTAAPAPGPHGYVLAAKNGSTFSFGAARAHSPAAHMHLPPDITGIAPTTGHDGYWLVASDGGVFAFGSANYAGSVPSSASARPVPNNAATSLHP
jgi:Peptidase A4 family